MNRRTFLQSLAAFSILPSATTYKRAWKAMETTGLVVPTYGVIAQGIIRIATGSTCKKGSIVFANGLPIGIALTDADDGGIAVYERPVGPDWPSIYCDGIIEESFKLVIPGKSSC